MMLLLRGEPIGVVHGPVRPNGIERVAKILVRGTALHRAWLAEDRMTMTWDGERWEVRNYRVTYGGAGVVHAVAGFRRA